MSKFGIQDNIDTLFTKRAIFVSLVLHTVFMMLRIHFEPLKVPEVRDDAIKVTFVPPAEVVKNKALKIASPLKEIIPPPKVVPKEKVVVGTQKVIPKATELGNPKAPVVQKVQKGDPMSGDKSAYKKNTDFQKLKTTNIGTGSAGATVKTNTPAGGSGDTYKGMDFAVKSLSNNAPLGGRFKLKNAADDMGAGAGVSGGIGNGLGKGFGDGTITGTPNGTVEKAKILTNVGSLTGAGAGTIASSRGAEGLSKKGAILLSGIPQETVVLGSMDPDQIRKILSQYLSQFRYCYQSELERTGRDDLSGVAVLHFDISPTGRVLNGRATGDSGLTKEVKNCVANVLSEIQFPEPKGGGKVQVKQPLNFYPNKI